MDILWKASGSEIEAESMCRIECEVNPEIRRRFSDAEWLVARRLVHTTADFGILNDLRFINGPVSAGLAALRRCAPIYADSNMIRSGLSLAKLTSLNSAYTRESILAPVSEPLVAAYAAKCGITRALAGVELYKDFIGNAVFLCGNAPLALAGVVKNTQEGAAPPALIIAMPVGFVNVVESKEYAQTLDVPMIVLTGRRGGSPLAVAALHGIMESAL